MIHEAYVSFETAKLLKEKGFVLNGYVRYDHNGARYHLDIIPNCKLDENDDVDCPTHQRACVWIREKGYHIYTFKGVDSWVYKVQSFNDDWTYHLGGFEDHDDAIEDALKYTLENLI